MSVMVTLVLLKVARMLAMPTAIFLEPLALMIFLALASSASNSAAVGAEGAATGPAGAAAPSAPAGAFLPSAPSDFFEVSECFLAASTGLLAASAGLLA